jgi:hypothetical protein
LCTLVSFDKKVVGVFVRFRATSTLPDSIFVRYWYCFPAQATTVLEQSVLATMILMSRAGLLEPI